MDPVVFFFFLGFSKKLFVVILKESFLGFLLQEFLQKCTQGLGSGIPQEVPTWFPPSGPLGVPLGIPSGIPFIENSSFRVFVGFVGFWKIPLHVPPAGIHSEGPSRILCLVLSEIQLDVLIGFPLTISWWILRKFIQGFSMSSSRRSFWDSSKG